MKMLALLTAISAVPSMALAGLPDRVYVYENIVDGVHNQFVIGPAGTPCGARYMLFENSSVEVDRLRYLGDREFPDGQGGTRPIVRCWLYEGSDGTGNTWQILFGRETLLNSNAYPIYYSFKDDGQFTRWATGSMTTRRSGRLADQVAAVFFQNQVDPSIFPRAEFSHGELDPLFPLVAWDECRNDLAELLQKATGADHPVDIPLLLTKTPAGNLRFRMPLQSAVVQQAISAATGFSDDTFIRIDRERRVRSIFTSQIRAEFRLGGVVNTALVGNAFREIIEDDANVLSSLNLSGETRLGDTRVTTVSKPWQRLSYPDTKNAHYWRIKYSLREAGDHQWDLCGFIEIGKRPLSEPDRDDRIRWITTTEDSPFYANFMAPVSSDTMTEIMDSTPVYVIRDSDEQIADVGAESPLSQLLEDVFRLCREKVIDE